MSNLTHIIVAGTPGALLGLAAGVLMKSGLSVLWPDQDTDITDGEMLLRYSLNVEVHNMHKDLLHSLNHSWLSAKMPKYFEAPYPGPAEYLSKFNTPAVIGATLLPPFIEIWSPHVDIVIDIRASAEEDIDALKQWSHNSLDDAYIAKVAEHYNTRYRSQLAAGFGSVFQMTNSELRNGQFVGLSNFLSDVFQPA